MGLFNKEKKGTTAVPAKAPEEPETEGEIKHIEELSESKETKDAKPDLPEQYNYREIPVCMSQEQINNLVIENNMMLKRLMTELD